MLFKMKRWIFIISRYFLPVKLLKCSFNFFVQIKYIFVGCYAIEILEFCKNCANATCAIRHIKSQLFLVLVFHPFCLNISQVKFILQVIYFLTIYLFLDDWRIFKFTQIIVINPGNLITPLPWMFSVKS